MFCLSCYVVYILKKECLRPEKGMFTFPKRNLSIFSLTAVDFCGGNLTLVDKFKKLPRDVLSRSVHSHKQVISTIEWASITYKVCFPLSELGKLSSM